MDIEADSPEPGRGPNPDLLAEAGAPTPPGAVEPILDARELVGLLADDDRRRVFAALVLGAGDVTEVRELTGLGLREAVTALGRLTDAGLVVADEQGRHYLLGEAFRLAARAAAPAENDDELADLPREKAKVMRSFFRDGRLLQIPTVRTKRLIVLDVLAQEFEPGRRYSESMVNLILGKFHDDVAALRRYLVDEEFMDRESGEYWRAGGSVTP